MNQTYSNFNNFNPKLKSMDKTIPKVIQANELKVIINKELSHAQEKQKSLKRIKSAPMFDLLNNPRAINRNKYYKDDDLNQKIEKRHNLVDDLVAKMGIVKHYSKDDLKQAGFDLENYHVTNTFKFFIHCEPSTVKYLKKNGINLYSNSADDIYFNKKKKNRYFNDIKPKVNTYREPFTSLGKEPFNLIRNGTVNDYNLFCRATVRSLNNGKYVLNGIIDENGWNVLHYAVFYNRPNFINYITRYDLVETNTVTYNDQTVMMLYGNYVDLKGFDLFYNSNQGVHFKDSTGRSMIFSLLSGCAIQIDPRHFIHEHIQSTHRSITHEKLKQINKTDFDTNVFKGIPQWEDKSNKKNDYNINTLIIQNSNNKYILSKEMMHLVVNTEKIKDNIKQIGFSHETIKEFILKQLTQARRVISVIERLKILNGYEENKNQYIDFLDQRDFYGKSTIEIALDTHNLFIIVYMLVVNKITISKDIVEKYSSEPQILDVNRLLMYYIVYKMELLPESTVAWLEECNFFNIFVYKRNKVSLKFNPYEYHLYKYSSYKERNQIKQQIFLVLRSVLYERYLHFNHCTKQAASDFMKFINAYTQNQREFEYIDRDDFSDETMSNQSFQFKGFIDNKGCDKYYYFEHQPSNFISDQIKKKMIRQSIEDQKRKSRVVESMSIDKVGENIIKDLYETNGWNYNGEMTDLKNSSSKKRPSSAYYSMNKSKSSNFKIRHYD